MMIQKIIHTIIFLVSSISIAQACTCISVEWQEKEIYDEHELIFIGKSLWHTFVPKEWTWYHDPFLTNDTKINLDVIDMIKWTDQNTITVWSNNKTSCGVTPQTDEEYIIYANLSHKNQYSIGTCNIIKRSQAEDFINHLQKIKKPEDIMANEIEKLSRYERFKRYLISFISLLW